jgi:mRNA interferase MazF
VFKRGDIVAVDFPFIDGAGSKVRPALVISNQVVNNSGDVIIALIKSKTSHPELLLEIDNALLSHPLPKQSYIRCHRLHAVHSSLLLHKVSVASPLLLEKVKQNIVKLIS